MFSFPLSTFGFITSSMTQGPSLSHSLLPGYLSLIGGPLQAPVCLSQLDMPACFREPRAKERSQLAMGQLE